MVSVQSTGLTVHMYLVSNTRNVCAFLLFIYPAVEVLPSDYLPRGNNVKLEKLGIFSNLLLTALKFVFLHNWTLLLSNKDLLWSHCLQLSPSPFLLQRNVVYFSSSASCQAV